MPSLYEDFSRLADEIVTLRQRFATASQERRANLEERRATVRSQLREHERTLTALSRVRQDAAATDRRGLRQEVDRLLADGRRTVAANGQARQSAANAQRASACAFLNDLTGQVALLRANFAEARTIRTAERQAIFRSVRDHLGAASADRLRARAAWRARLSGAPATSPAQTVAASSPEPVPVPVHAVDVAVPAFASESANWESGQRDHSNRSGRRRASSVSETDSAEISE
ncbi:hypothetical protein [Methylosinus sp. KRF6]|uniref:hypothetical protein n=1 Tax=Methylosinus sp. KRF6 TaxID=2846853 RepID=UPI001C0E5950|nr:hypothetical protein [Methylosinus sp. KRF6]MBU3890909.1 hypothetical protein [Methylosinus sp. KRF6]